MHTSAGLTGPEAYFPGPYIFCAFSDTSRALPHLTLTLFFRVRGECSTLDVSVSGSIPQIIYRNYASNITANAPGLFICSSFPLAVPFIPNALADLSPIARSEPEGYKVQMYACSAPVIHDLPDALVPSVC